MSVARDDEHRKEFKKAKDLKVIERFETDNSPEGKLRMEQARAIICQLILLSKKRGRPSRQKEEFDAAA